MSILTKEASKSSSLKLSKNFKLSELACKGSGCCSKVMWAPELIERLQWIRDKCKKPIVINSGYRCQTHNNRVGGVASSKHLYGMAADLAVPRGMGLDEFAALAESAGFRGVLKYTGSCFIHVDLRETKPYRAVTASGNGFRPVVSFGGEVRLNPGIRPNRTVRKGTTAVANALWIQFQLKKAGFDCGELDGIYGSKTYTAVKNFQAARGLKVDGICGTGETIPALGTVG